MPPEKKVVVIEETLRKRFEKEAEEISDFLFAYLQGKVPLSAFGALSWVIISTMNYMYESAKSSLDMQITDDNVSHLIKELQKYQNIGRAFHGKGKQGNA